MSEKDSIVIMGLKNSGKSTLGKMLADKLGYNFYDTDSVMEEMTGLSPRDLYSQQGVTQFMLEEEKACTELVKKIGNEKLVISTGGGICDNAPACHALREANLIIFLKSDMKISVRRIMSKITYDEESKKFTNLPAFLVKDKPKKLNDVRDLLMNRFEERYAKYESICDVAVEVGDASKEENLNKLLNALDKANK